MLNLEDCAADAVTATKVAALGSTERDVIPTPLGLESQRNANANGVPPFILLMRSGHFEFCVPLFPWICFKQPLPDYKQRPRLWPRAIVELPLSFLLLVKLLYKRIGISGSFIASTEYHNLRARYCIPDRLLGGYS